MCAWRVPGVSYVPLVPLIVAALAGLPFTLRKTPGHNAALSNESDTSKSRGPIWNVLVSLCFCPLQLRRSLGLGRLFCFMTAWVAGLSLDSQF